MSSSPGYLTISFGAGCEAPSVAGAAADHANAAAPDAVLARRSQLRKTNSRLTAAMAGALLSPGSPQGVEKDSSIKERERAKRWSGQVGSGRVSRVSSKRAWRVKSASAAGVGGRAATFFVPEVAAAVLVSERVGSVGGLTQPKSGGRQVHKHVP